MGGDNSNSTMTDDGNNMYFAPWKQYQLHILFISWDVTSQGGFVLSWFAVAAAAVFQHYLDCVLKAFDTAMAKHLDKESHSDINVLNKKSAKNVVTVRPKRPTGWFVVKTLRGLIGAFKYAMSLMLMLVAMTFNPSLFLALFVGYWIGDVFLCDYRLDTLMNVSTTLLEQSGALSSIIRWALCVPIVPYRPIVPVSDNKNYY